MCSEHTYSIGAYYDSGQTFGVDGITTLEQAVVEMARMATTRQFASISVFEWSGDECEEVSAWDFGKIMTAR